jgi:hypothetical protein
MGLYIQLDRIVGSSSESRFVAGCLSSVSNFKFIAKNSAQSFFQIITH